jgi:hypothetical protein
MGDERVGVAVHEQAGCAVGFAVHQAIGVAISDMTRLED